MTYFILTHIPGTPKSFWAVLESFGKNAKTGLNLHFKKGENGVKKHVFLNSYFQKNRWFCMITGSLIIAKKQNL